jgi:hypothetical protein
MNLLDTLIGTSISEKDKRTTSPASPRPLESQTLCQKASPSPPASPLLSFDPQGILPAMPQGVRLVRWEPKAAPVAIDVCSVVVDVPRFIESELRALDSRLNSPWTIHGGFTVPQMLDRLAQAGVEVELEPKGGAFTAKSQNTEGEAEIK